MMVFSKAKHHVQLEGGKATGSKAEASKSPVAVSGIKQPVSRCCKGHHVPVPKTHPADHNSSESQQFWKSRNITTLYRKKEKRCWPYYSRAQSEPDSWKGWCPRSCSNWEVVFYVAWVLTEGKLRTAPSEVHEPPSSQGPNGSQGLICSSWILENDLV